jgi:hypothetical protein
MGKRPQDLIRIEEEADKTTLNFPRAATFDFSTNNIYKFNCEVSLALLNKLMYNPKINPFMQF